MAKKNFYDFVIVGAGIAGLTLASELVRNGKSVLVVERDKVVGGLGKSFHYRYQNKELIFDIGPKRFHTEDKEVLSFIKGVLKKNYLVTGRKSSIYAFGSYYNWPITTRDIFKLPNLIKTEIVFDLVKKIVGLTKDRGSKRFDDYIKEKYGDSLYKYFFKDYTEKFTGVPAKTMSADWASTGINRSIIDKRSKGYSIFDLVKNVILPTPVNTKFIYPKKDGFGYFTNELAKIVKKNGGSIVTGKKIEAMDIKRSKISIEGKKYGYSKVIWTGNLHDLGRLLGDEYRGLEYISTIFYNFLVKKKSIRDDMWVYCHYHKYGGEKLHSVRVSIGNNFASYVMPKGYKGIVVEKTCRFGDKVWKNPDNYKKNITQELLLMGLIDSEDQVEKVYVEAVRDTYPLYKFGYKKYVGECEKKVNRRSKDVILLGRSGSFWYNNADHSIKAALGLSRRLLGKSDQEVDKESIFS